MRVALIALTLTSTACVHSPAQSARALEASAEECTSFAEFDAQVRSQLDEVLARPPSAELLDAGARLSAARRVCARHLLAVLRVGASATTIQRELDAIAEAFPARTVRAMADEALGDDVVTVRPMLAQAIATAQTRQREVRLQSLSNPPPRPPDELSSGAQAHTCTSRDIDAALDCLAELLRHDVPLDDVRREAEGLAATRLEVAAALPPDARARAVAGLLDHLEPLGETKAWAKAMALLAELRASQWPTIEATLAAGAVERAAALAEPYLRLPKAHEAVMRLRDEAAAKHLELARRPGVGVAYLALHRHVAMRFGAPEVPWPTQEGTWDTSRYQCTTGLPALPKAPTGSQLRLVARCREEAHAPDRSKDDELRTFELERTLPVIRIDGSVTVTCAGVVQTFPLAVRELAVEGLAAAANEGATGEPGTVMGPGHAVFLALDRVVAQASLRCKQERATTLVEACDALAERGAAEVENDFTERALINGSWAECFAPWFLARYGVELPALQ